MESKIGIIFGFIIGYLVSGLIIFGAINTPTELPNGCILYEETIWCKESTEE